MDFSVKNERILADRVLTDESDERPVDCDFVLPDYDPDVSAVLKCVMKPMVQSRQRSGVCAAASLRSRFLPLFC